MEITQQFLPYYQAVDLFTPTQTEPPRYIVFSEQGEDTSFPREFIKVGDDEEPFSEGFECGYKQLADDLIETAIKVGHVKAYGRETDEKNETPHYKLIPSEFLEQFDSETDYDPFYRSMAFYNGEKIYYDVHVCREDVETFFGWWFKRNDSTQPNGLLPSEGAALGKVETTIKAEQECRLWLIELAEQKCCKTKREIWLEASKKFEGTLSLRGFGRVWDAVAPREWKASGRRYKKS